MITAFAALFVLCVVASSVCFMQKPNDQQEVADE